MKRFSLRVRLAAASAVGVLVVMVLAGLAQFALLRNAATRRVNTELTDTVQIVQGARALDALFEAATGGRSSDTAPSVLQSITSPGLRVNEVLIRGDRAISTDLVDTGAIPLDDGIIEQAQTGQSDYFDTTRIGGTRFRVLSRVVGTTPTGATQLDLVARSMADIVAAESNFVVFLLAGTVLTVLIAGSLGYLITRQAMRPVRRLASTANEIARTADLKKRVVEGGQDRDLSNLTATFNQMLDTLESAYDRIRAALDAERRFVANASHELRTPLTTIRGNVDYLARTGGDAEAVGDLRESTERLSALVASLTELAREEAGMMVEDAFVDFDELVRDVAAEPAYDADGVDMHVEIQDDEVWVKGSEASLASVVRNLLENAVKYGSGRVDVHLNTQNGYAVLEVRDDGPGIPRENVERVFERFWRADDVQGAPGSGLGLSIVLSAVRAHAGEARAYPGPGGHFEVRLPVVAGPGPDDRGEEEHGRPA